MKVVLPKEDRDEIFAKLTPAQQEFIQNSVKRGKKTIFANEMAADKGIVLPPGIESNEMEYLLDEWVLVDYIDNGFQNPETPCECGRPLRYQYIVKHKSTNEVRRFGITHFEEHTEIPAELVRRIKNGFQTIEYEMDELLIKLNDGWNIKDELPYLPDDYEFPADMQQHLDANVPLLDRQVKRLKQKELSFVSGQGEREQRESDGNRGSAESNTSAGGENAGTDTFSNPFGQVGTGAEISSNTAEAVTINLFGEEEVPDPKNEKDLVPYALDQKYRSAALKYLEEGVTSARILSELLIKNEGAPGERYTSRKPKIYVGVCFYLDLLVSRGQAKHIGKLELDDRYYKLV
ncbi:MULTISPECIES: DUF3895 domain-containing protein [Bacillaceae]|uniref:DUF3895 domain-containing protein n=1 Tax=Evansella alkalicola TaxID=745819 RepID=A0ABS6JV01_9BACI|nr:MULTISPECIES: DUF3895 domain-containing protein [Bacillaceae]MBU9722408.1 DUF3895 domain-containing protein [Bacillus alkalicola]